MSTFRHFIGYIVLSAADKQMKRINTFSMVTRMKCLFCTY